MNVRDLLIKQASLYPDKTAIFFEDTKIGFSKLKSNTFRFSNYLHSLNIKEEDKIAIFLPNNLEAVYAYLGVLSLGAVIVPFDFMLTEDEIIHFLNHSEAKLLVIQPKKEININNIESRCKALEKIIVCKTPVENFPYWDDILKASLSSSPVYNFRESNLSSLFYTSGSTGHPKGVMLTYGHFDNAVTSMNHSLNLHQNDILLCAGLPFSHLGGFDYLTVFLSLGCGLVLMERFNPLEVLRNIEKFRVSFLWMVPPMYVAILSLKEYDKFDLSSVKYLNVFGAPSSPVLLRRFHKACPNAHFMNGWGMTETAAPNCYLPPGFDKIESIGKFTPGLQAKIVDDSGNTLGPGQEGELWVKGKPVMLGYYKEPELTKEVLTQEGWFKTGDIAKFDEYGLCYIVGRKKDMIKVGGEIVFSTEVEEKIHRYPKVKEVAVIGVSDTLRGEVPKAFIVPNEGASLSEQELKEFVKKHLAHFKIPRYFEFVDNIPKTKSGKIDKKELASKSSPC